MSLFTQSKPRLLALLCTGLALLVVGCRYDKETKKGNCPTFVLDSANTPIKGGGGAFTLYSQRKWNKVKDDPTSWCARFDASVLSATPTITFGGFDHNDGTVQYAGPLLMYGHAPGAATASSHGLRLEIFASSDCQAPANGGAGSKITSVKLSVINPSGSVGFYDDPLPHKDQSQDDKRFRDNEPGCSRDEDLCERLALVKTSDGSSYTCTDGDCSFVIGEVPQSRASSSGERNTTSQAQR